MPEDESEYKLEHQLEYKVEQLYLHPKYSRIRYMGNLGYENKDFDDIAALVLDRDLEAVKPVSIIPSRLIQPGQEVILAGYGAYSQSDKMARPLTRVTTTISSIGARFRDFQLSVNEKGACFGDSGGPMYVKHPEKRMFSLGRNDYRPLPRTTIQVRKWRR